MQFQEDFLHFVWQQRQFESRALISICGQPIDVIHPGTANADAGPDFSAARIRIGDTLWAGNIELHLKSSDWNKHGHQHNIAYNNVILHVVYTHDMDEIQAPKGVPVLELKDHIRKGLMQNFQAIMNAKTWIPCQKSIHIVDQLIVHNWLSRLLVERLERKSEEILHFLNYYENSWEDTFYYFLARNFGFKVNATAFGILAGKTPYKLLARHKNNLTQLEALLLGQAGLLEKTYQDVYPRMLQHEYAFLRHKYQLDPMDAVLWKFARMRPANFPGIRLAQFASLIHKSSGLFRQLMENQKVDDLKNLLETDCSIYWKTHYVFDKVVENKSTRMGSSSIENILINTIASFKFVYGQQSLRDDIRDGAIALLSGLKPEKNKITKQWDQLRIEAEHAADSQALLELKKYYCTAHKCIRCPIGHKILNQTF